MKAKVEDLIKPWKMDGRIYKSYVGFLLTFPDGSKRKVLIYEPSNAEYIPHIKSFICSGHEEIKIVTQGRKKIEKFYTR